MLTCNLTLKRVIDFLVQMKNLLTQNSFSEIKSIFVKREGILKKVEMNQKINSVLCKQRNVCGFFLPKSVLAAVVCWA